MTMVLTPKLPTLSASLCINGVPSASSILKQFQANRPRKPSVSANTASESKTQIANSKLVVSVNSITLLPKPSIPSDCHSITHSSPIQIGNYRIPFIRHRRLNYALQAPILHIFQFFLALSLVRTVETRRRTIYPSGSTALRLSIWLFSIMHCFTDSLHREAERILR